MRSQSVVVLGVGRGATLCTAVGSGGSGGLFRLRYPRSTIALPVFRAVRLGGTGARRDRRTGTVDGRRSARAPSTATVQRKKPPAKRRPAIRLRAVALAGGLGKRVIDYQRIALRHESEEQRGPRLPLLGCPLALSQEQQPKKPTMPLTFDLDGVPSYLHELQQEAEEYLQDDLNQKKARNLAVTMWHVWDWVYSVHGEFLGYSSLGDLQNQVRSRCPEFGYIQDIATAKKHRDVTRYQARLKEARKGGAFSREFSRAFDVVSLRVALMNGTELEFEQVVKKALAYLKVFEGCLPTVSNSP